MPRRARRRRRRAGAGDPQRRSVVQGRRRDRRPAALGAARRARWSAARSPRTTTSRQLLAAKTPLVIGVVLALGFLLLLVALQAPIIAAARRADQPAGHRRRVRRRPADLPGGPRQRPAGLRAPGLPRRLGAGVLLRDDLRDLDGLHRVPALARPRSTGTAATTPRRRWSAASRTPGASSSPPRAVMVAVFFTFALSGPLPPKEMGVILGVAVLLDAALVRLLLVPVLLRLLGKWAWWLPKPLRPRSSPTSASATPRRPTWPFFASTSGPSHPAPRRTGSSWACSCIVDVRSDAEWGRVRVPGATHIPLGQVARPPARASPRPAGRVRVPLRSPQRTGGAPGCAAARRRRHHRRRHERLAGRRPPRGALRAADPDAGGRRDLPQVIRGDWRALASVRSPPPEPSGMPRCAWWRPGVPSKHVRSRVPAPRRRCCSTGWAVTPAFAALGDEVAAGGAIAKQLQAHTTSCSKLSDTDFEHLGEYVMERTVGSRAAHAAMNQRMASMMGSVCRGAHAPAHGPQVCELWRRGRRSRRHDGRRQNGWWRRMAAGAGGAGMMSSSDLSWMRTATGST